MIKVTRLNGTRMIINALLIESIEHTPDTLITLTTGNKFMVLEKDSEVVDLVRTYMKSLGLIGLALQTQETEDD